MLLSRADVFSRLTKYAEAEADLTRALSYSPSYLGALEYRGYVRYMMGNYTAAIEDFDNYISINDRSGYVYHRRGLSHHKLFNNFQACQDLRRARDLGFQFDLSILKTTCGE